MSITILYFASLREALGVEREQLDLPKGIGSVTALRAWLVARGSQWQPLSAPRVRAAVNQTLATEAAAVSDGDEIAFFPPVTGG
ncbi:MAG TPA: molybdopterin converting factor subunit 1 [Rhodocyclaceae bacterium]|nr:molybdopterin converting factor subunit 1 [Rhodocyclaceae bacterium]